MRDTGSCCLAVAATLHVPRRDGGKIAFNFPIRSMLWPEDVSGMVEKVMVCLLGRYTVIKEPVGAVNIHWLVLCGMAM